MSINKECIENMSDGRKRVLRPLTYYVLLS